ncbi:hypothetical protein I317_04445 [Kwoniella heveanensis CBS 569]|nr:hypothetical protein I317_04445 [Kwoniella heveanensis CBS 569]
MTRQPGRSAVTRFLEPVRTLLTDATFDTNVPETPRLSCKIIRPPQSGSEVDKFLKKFEGELTLDEGTELMCLKFPPSASQITCDGLTIQPDTAVAESLQPDDDGPLKTDTAYRAVIYGKRVAKNRGDEAISTIATFMSPSLASSEIHYIDLSGLRVRKREGDNSRDPDRHLIMLYKPSSTGGPSSVQALVAEKMRAVATRMIKDGDSAVYYMSREEESYLNSIHGQTYYDSTIEPPPGAGRVLIRTTTNLPETAQLPATLCLRGPVQGDLKEVGEMSAFSQFRMMKK